MALVTALRAFFEKQHFSECVAPLGFVSFVVGVGNMRYPFWIDVSDAPYLLWGFYVGSLSEDLEQYFENKGTGGLETGSGCAVVVSNQTVFLVYPALMTENTVDELVPFLIKRAVDEAALVRQQLSQIDERRQVAELSEGERQKFHQIGNIKGNA